ncbi:MAG TPA: hypothetical protein VHX11_07590 [Acidobacteriaceae bacterium]|nr:hypothetical protein [Acidobacteriaceae bacterium]
MKFWSAVGRRAACSRSTVALLILALLPVARAAAPEARPSVPPCRGINLTANYLSSAGPGLGEGFQFILENSTDQEIRLAEPVPSSSHWYALTRGKWLWRASNGAGGSLFDAANERGRLLVYKDGSQRVLGATFTVKPHQTRRWVETDQENPVLAYKPGCPICSYPGEHEYRVIFAYAYLPGERRGNDGLLECGLRSNAVPMPPKP